MARIRTSAIMPCVPDFPEDILSTPWVPKEIRLDDERTL